jgi:hypothetical protein
LGYVPAYHTQFALFFNEKAPGCFMTRRKPTATPGRRRHPAGRKIISCLSFTARGAFACSLFPEGPDLPFFPARPYGPGNQGAF